MSRAFNEAIEAGRAILGDGWKGKYATFDRQFGLTELNCPTCGVVIAKWMPVGAQQVRRIKNQTIIQEGMALARLANYKEVLFEMTDGNRHVANMCADCAGKMDDPAMAIARYAADLAQWSSEGKTLDDATCNRAPVGIIATGDFIQDDKVDTEARPIGVGRGRGR